jgi:hypothetical protein
MIKRLAISGLILVMVIAIWSRLSTMKEGPIIIRNFADTLARLFRGVLK